ncbi:hypothetical protein [Hydrogenimonas sp.]
MGTKVAVALLVVLAVLILWRLSSRTPPAVSFNEEAMVLRQGECALAIPMKKIEIRHLTADALAIDRTFATFYNGYTLVDEKISMPAHYTFGQALDAVVSEVFRLKELKTLARNGKMALYEGLREDGTPLKVLAIFKGKSDLELLYPINDTFEETVRHCLIEGKKAQGPVVVNVVEGENDETLPLSDWNEKLFELELIVNKDM